MASAARGIRIGTLLLTGLLSLSACASSIGQNVAYQLVPKRDLRYFYAFDEWANQTDTLERRGVKPENISRAIDELRIDREYYLRQIYTTNLPLSFTDRYDVRAKLAAGTQIQLGKPLAITVNRVHITDNGALLGLGTLAVVISVDDGRKEREPKHILVGYERGVPRNVDLPIGDILAYYTENYQAEPVRIELTVFSLTKQENEVLSQILTTAAGIGKLALSATPAAAFAPLLGPATEVGKILIKSRQDQVLAKFTFQLYPWDQGEPRHQLGVPRISYGHYVVLHFPGAIEGLDHRQLHADFNFDLYQVKVETAQLPSPLGSDAKLKPWPLPASEEMKYPRERFATTYMVLTVSSTPLTQAQELIRRMHESLSAAAGVLEVGKPPANIAAELKPHLEGMVSLAAFIVTKEEFERKKSSSRSFELLFNRHDDLKEPDQIKLRRLIRQTLPDISAFLKEKKIDDKDPLDLKSLRDFYDSVKDEMKFDEKEGKWKVKR